MLESWLTSSAKIKKRCCEKVCFRENVDVAGNVHFSLLFGAVRVVECVLLNGKIIECLELQQELAECMN
jgi:hypothetical protein